MTEDELRRIIREEIREALKVLSAEATDLPSYDSDHVEDVAAHVVSRAADYTLSTLEHDSDCPKRAERGWSRCGCGVG